MKTLQDVIKEGPAIVSGRIRKTHITTTFAKAKKIILPNTIYNFGAYFENGEWTVIIGYKFGSLHNEGGLDSVRELFGFYN